MSSQLFLPLLQSLPTLKGGDTRSTIIGLAVFGAFILFLIFAGARGGGGKPKSSGGMSKRAFKRYATNRGLNRHEIHLLQGVAQRAKTEASKLLLSSGALDSALKRTFLALKTEPSPGVDIEVRKFELYRIKQKLERSSGGASGNYGSTKQLKLGQPITIQDEGGERFQSKINGNLQKDISITVPVDRRGNQVRWKKWTKVKCYFWRPNGQGYSFSSKVLAYNQLRGVSSLFLQHSDRIKQEQQRRFRRRDMNRPAYFYPIKVITSGTGKQVQKKAVVEHRRGTLATLNDISAGGCAMKSNYPLATGELLKIEFDSGKGQVNVYGKVQSVNKIRPTGGIMHVKFTKLSRKNLNKINSYVYGLETMAAKNSYLLN